MEDVSVKFVITQQIDYTFTHDDYMYVSIYITTQSNLVSIFIWFVTKQRLN